MILTIGDPCKDLSLLFGATTQVCEDQSQDKSEMGNWNGQWSVLSKDPRAARPWFSSVVQSIEWGEAAHVVAGEKTWTRAGHVKEGTKHSCMKNRRDEEKVVVNV